MIVFDWVYYICSLVTTVCISCFSLYGLIDYFRLRRIVKLQAAKELEEINIDNVSS